MKSSTAACVTFLVFSLAIRADAEPTVESTTVLGPFTGEGAPLHPDNESPHRIEYYGTDLGFSYRHDGKIHFLFGDTWATEAYSPIEKSTGGRFDDSFGSIDILEWPDPTKISRDNMPLIRLGQNPGSTEAATIQPYHAMDLGKTPMAAFSNGEREYGIFNLTKPLGCRIDSDCGGDLVCDTGLGYAGNAYDVQEGLTLGCLDGAAGCNPDPLNDAEGHPVEDSGLCASSNSTVRGHTEPGRAAAVALRVLVGMRSPADPGKYPVTREWLSNKFLNLTVRTVQAFDPVSGPGDQNQDYSTAGGAGPDRRVLLWGRPGFVGVGATGRPLGLYFAYVDIPRGEDLEWKVRYYAGTDEKGIPHFSTSQGDAVPADLDSSHPGVQAGEAHDVVNQMSVVWIDHLKKWVMFYSGGMQTLPKPGLPRCGLLELFSGSECQSAVVGNGAVRMRTADDPWGPWTPPHDVIVGGSPDAYPVGGQYAAGGMLHHPDCVGDDCAPATETPYYSEREYGFYYASNIVESWITPAGEGVDVIWNASTWDPYRVVLLKTRIRP